MSYGTIAIIGFIFFFGNILMDKRGAKVIWIKIEFGI